MNEERIQSDIINSGDAVRIVCKTLGLVDDRLVNHGERVAYLLHHMLRYSEKYSASEKLKIFCLGIFHDIGAYKTEDIDKMMSFEADNIWEHSIYGFLFLKYLSPLKNQAEAILYHHLNYDRYDQVQTEYQDIALMIKLIDFIDISMQIGKKNIDLARLEREGGTRFDPEHVDIFLKANAEYHLLENLKDRSYVVEVNAILDQLMLTPEEIDRYLQMMAYSIDFRSAYTVTHTITTLAISDEIVRRLGYSNEKRAKVYYGALLHDVGKNAIPLEILEFPGKLSYQSMQIMRTHVEVSEEMLRGAVSDEICEIAISHHEKLDGTGYHRGLSEENLNESQQIVAVADILSALRQQRSYKNAFSKDEIIRIIQIESDAGRLSKKICEMVVEQYDQVMALADENCEEFLKMYENLRIEYDQIYAEVIKITA